MLVHLLTTERDVLEGDEDQTAASAAKDPLADADDGRAGCFPFSADGRVITAACPTDLQLPPSLTTANTDFGAGGVGASGVLNGWDCSISEDT